MMKSHDDRSLLHYPFLINQLSVSRQQTNLKGVVLSSCRNFLRYAMPWNSGAFMDEYSSLKRGFWPKKSRKIEEYSAMGALPH